MENEKRLIDANALHESLRESLEELRKIRDGLASDVEKQICNGQIASFVEAILRVKDATTVDAVEVVHGEWQDGWGVNHVGEKAYDSIDCSHCEEIFKIESETREYWKNRFKVCPFCGALMDGGNEDV